MNDGCIGSIATSRGTRTTRAKSRRRLQLASRKQALDWAENVVLRCCVVIREAFARDETDA